MTDTPPRSTPTPPMTSHSKRRASLAVVSVNYRTADLAIDAARSVVDELAAIGGRCVIVDNFSADGSVARLQGFAASPAARGVVHIVASPVNGGFSAGNNLGFAAIDADWYLLLNSDASAAPGALSAMLRAAEAAPGCGLVTPTIADRQGGAQVSRFRRHSPLGELIEGAQTGPVTRLFQRASAPIAPDDWATPPDWV
ncbi:MAG: glycosyltransferase, partial [Pseudomonadota bacterium]